MTTLSAFLCVTTVLTVTMASSANQLFTLKLTCANSYVPADSVFGDVSGVRSRADCARLCQSRDACSAFDVGEAGGECRFHQLTLAQKQCSAVVWQGTTLYYEMNHSCVNDGQYDRQAGACQCPVNYSGDACEIYNPCQNGGTYNAGSGLCTCPPNYFGTLCGIYNPCQNGGTYNAGSGLCTCPANYFGTLCGTYNPCQNGGTYNAGSSTCTCSANYVGTLCDTYNPCQNGAYSNNQCVCDTYWYGAVCSIHCSGIFVPCTETPTCRCKMDMEGYSGLYS